MLFDKWEGTVFIMNVKVGFVVLCFTRRKSIFSPILFVELVIFLNSCVNLKFHNLQLSIIQFHKIIQASNKISKCYTSNTRTDIVEKYLFLNPVMRGRIVPNWHTYQYYSSCTCHDIKHVILFVTVLSIIHSEFFVKNSFRQNYGNPLVNVLYMYTIRSW